MTLYVVPKIKRFLVKEKSCDASLVDLFFELDSIGVCYPLDAEGMLTDALGYYRKWEDMTCELWAALEKKEGEEHFSSQERLAFTLQWLFDKNEDIFIDNDGFDELERKMACWAAFKVSLDLLMTDIYSYLDKEDLNDWTPKDFIESDQEEAVLYLKQMLDRAVFLIMLLNILVGSTKESHATFYMIKDSPIKLAGFGNDVSSLFKSSPVASKRCQKLFDTYFSDMFREHLGLLSRSGNYVVDIIYNDKTREFITVL